MEWITNQKQYGPTNLGKKTKTSLFGSEHQYDTELSAGSIQTLLTSWKSSQEGREIVSQVFPVSVDVLFELLFNNSKFYNQFQESRKTFGKHYWQAIS